MVTSLVLAASMVVGQADEPLQQLGDFLRVGQVYRQERTCDDNEVVVRYVQAEWVLNKNAITYVFATDKAFEDAVVRGMFFWDPATKQVTITAVTSDGGVLRGTWTRDGDEWMTQGKFIDKDGNERQVEGRYIRDGEGFILEADGKRVGQSKPISD